MSDVKYENLSRGRKQQIDLQRRKELEKAKAIPESRTDNAVYDALNAFARLRSPSLKPSDARGNYKRWRDSEIQKAQDRADYKDLADKRLYFEDSSKTQDDIGADAEALHRAGKPWQGFRVSQEDREPKKKEEAPKGMKKGGSVRGVGIAKRGFGCGGKVKMR